MATEVTQNSYLSRVGNAIKGVVVGLIFVIGSTFFLFSNEGSVDLSEIAVDATEIFGIENIDEKAGQFIALTGEVSTDEVLTDEYVSYDGALLLDRKFETYAWVESSESETTTNAGGSSTTRTTYSYNQQWVTDVPDSSQFNDPVGHENFDNDYQNGSFMVDRMNVAGLDISTDGLRFPGADVNVTGEVEVLTDEFETGGSYLFNGFGTLSSPEVGDVRLSYNVVPELETGSVFGVWNAEREVMDPFFEGESKVYGLYKGNKATALETMHNEYLTKLWLVRGLSLLFMFVGFNLILAPLHTVLDVIPAVGRMGKGAASIVSLILTILLGGITIILGKVWYSWVLFAIIGVVAVGVGYGFYKKSNK